MSDAAAFERFFAEAKPLVRRAVVSRFGPSIGRDATAEAFTVAWHSWQRVSKTGNPAGYVYRIAERMAMRQLERTEPQPVDDLAVEDKYSDHELVAALDELSPRQRQAVVLVEGMGMTHREAAEFLGCARSSLQNHVERGLARLRKTLEVNDNAR